MSRRTSAGGQRSPRMCSFRFSPVPTPRKKRPSSISDAVAAPPSCRFVKEARRGRFVDQTEHGLLAPPLDRRLPDVGLLGQVDQHGLDREAVAEAVEHARVYI